MAMKKVLISNVFQEAFVWLVFNRVEPILSGHALSGGQLSKSWWVIFYSSRNLTFCTCLVVQNLHNLRFKLGYLAMIIKSHSVTFSHLPSSCFRNSYGAFRTISSTCLARRTLEATRKGALTILIDMSFSIMKTRPWLSDCYLPRFHVRDRFVD